MSRKAKAIKNQSEEQKVRGERVNVGGSALRLRNGQVSLLRYTASLVGNDRQRFCEELADM